MEFIRRIQLSSARSQLRKARADFYLDIADALDDRVALVTIMSSFESRARQRKTPLAPLFSDMLRKLQKGSLVAAFQGVAPPSELILIDALQNASDREMADSLRFLAGTVEKTDRMIAVMRSALNYPIIIMTFLGAMMYGFSIFAVPVLAEFVKPEKWPLLGRILYMMSTVVRSYGIFIVVGIVSTLGLFLYSLPRWQSPIRRKLDRVMPYRLYRDFSGAMLLVSISTVMRSGVSLRSALERAMRHCNPWMLWHLRTVLRRLSQRESSNFGVAFQTGMLAPAMEDRVFDASRRRDPVSAFVRIGVSSIDRITAMIERSAATLNGMMLAIAGVILGTMILGFFLTAQDLQSGIREQAMNTGK